MRYLLYLAGPITGLTYAECTDWRDWVRAQLPPDIVGLSPMRGRGVITGPIMTTCEDCPLSTARGITVRDRYDVMRSDAVLVNLLGATQVSIGTVLEIAWADAARKPIILAMEPGNPHEHSMIRECVGFVADRLDEAVKIAKAVLDPDAARDKGRGEEEG